MNGKVLPMHSEEMRGFSPTCGDCRETFRPGSESAAVGLRASSHYGPQTRSEAGHSISGSAWRATGPMDRAVRGAGRVPVPGALGAEVVQYCAGMARLNTAAAFIKANMRLGEDNTLTSQQALDIAVYFRS